MILQSAKLIVQINIALNTESEELGRNVTFYVSLNEPIVMHFPINITMYLNT